MGLPENGGLVLPDPQGSDEGDIVVLDVKIKSLKQTYKLAARVVKRAPDSDRAFVAFDEGQEQDMMLNAAWADSHEVPQRKHRRYPTGKGPLHAPVSRRDTLRGQILDVSPGGCRLRGAGRCRSARACASSRSGIELDGQVRWTRRARDGHRVPEARPGGAGAPRQSRLAR